MKQCVGESEGKEMLEASATRGWWCWARRAMALGKVCAGSGTTCRAVEDGFEPCLFGYEFVIFFSFVATDGHIC